MELNQIDLNKVRVFASVARRGSVAAAAKSLAVTPSAVSQSLGALELQMGLALFERSGRALRLTENGEQLLGAYVSYEQELESLLEGFAASGAQVSGVIRIGIFLGFFRREFTQAVSRFLASCPDAQVKYVYAAPSEFEDLLSDGKLDMALSFAPPEKLKKLQATPLWEQELLLLCKRSLMPRQASLEALLALPLVDYYSTPLLFARWAKHHFGKSPPPKNIRALGASAQAVLDLISEGVGIGVVPRDLAEPLLKKRTLVSIPGSRVALTGKIWLLEPKRSREPSRFSVFRAFLQEQN
ncbi:MAG: LysR family transcriptional regulator [Deltaproteobacteria bacterium]|nr:LysR family transcriptional regulator [Deltaproteobacteria bacterium]